MSSRLLTDAFREIRNTRSRFLSLMVLSALAVCFLAGLRATAPDMKRSADEYFDGQKLMDLRVVSTLGLTEEDALALADRPGVAAVERARSVDAVVHLPENDYIVKALSFTEDPGLNAPRLVEGRMPENAGECLAEPLLLQEAGLSLGDVLTLDPGEGEFQDVFPNPSFTIVGAADSPLYVGVERGSSSLGTGKVSAFVLLPLESFDMEGYTDFYLALEGAAELSSYSDAYTELVDGFTDGLEAFAGERAKLRGDSIREEANEKLADAEQELADAEADAERELDEAWAELQDGRKELDDGWAEYRDGERTLRRETEDARRELDEGRQKLADALQELNDGEQELLDGRAELDEGWDDYRRGLDEYNEGLVEYRDGEQKYQDGLDEYNEGLEEFEDGKREVARGWREYRDGEAQYSAGAAELARGRRTLEEQEKVFQEGLTAFRLSLPALGLSAFETNAALQAAMGVPEQAAAIDAALEGARQQLAAGIAQAEETAARLEEQLEQARQAAAALPGQIAQLEGQTIPYLQEQAAALRGQMDGETDPDVLAALQGQLQTLEGQLAAAQAGLEQARTGLAQAQAAIPRLEAGIKTARETQKEMEARQEALYTTVNGKKVPVSTQVFRDGQRQINQGWDQIWEGEAQLADAAEQLADAYRQLRRAERELEAAEEELNEGWAELEDARLELEDGWAELEEGRLELEDALQKLNDGERDLLDGRAGLDDGWQEYSDGLRELEDGERELREETARARRELNDALQELNDGEAEYADGLKEYEDGKAEAEEKIADARKELEQARRDIEDIEECEWYLLGRNTNMGYVSYSMDADRMGNLASVFPLIFFLVAALVCLTTMTRMVEEQRVTIGGLKALGYSRGAIAVKYVGYGFLASAAGSLLGLAVGLTLLPWIICNAWNIIYTLGPVRYGLEPVTSALACLAAVGTVTLSALGACFSALAAVPAQLMRPKAPPAGKRVLLERLPFVWRRLSFNYKITIRNLFRYQRRFWMTVIGIGGCAALIVTAFGLRGSIFDVMDKQYDEIYRYTAEVGLVNKVTPGELREAALVLDGSGLVAGWTACRSEQVTAGTAAYTVDCNLQTASGQEELERFVCLRHRRDSRPAELPEDGAVLTEKLAKLLNVKAGDTFTLDGDKRVEVRVADVTEHYIQHFIYMTDGYYESLFGTRPQSNLILADYPVGAEETEALERELVALDGVTSLSRVADTRKTFTSSLESVDYAVVLIIVCAAALAFVVLYNLTNINITERMRELATLKVLGFYDGELSAYVYRENIILTVFGVGLGMVMGRLLHRWLILTVEIDLLMFGRELALSSYGYAVVLTVVFSLLVNLAAHRKLKKLDMVESLKTVE